MIIEAKLLVKDFTVHSGNLPNSRRTSKGVNPVKQSGLGYNGGVAVCGATCTF